MRRVGVSAATDVTGFGLLGHLGEIVRGSGVTAEIEFAAVPLLPGSRRLAEENVVPGGTLRNLDAASRSTRFGDLDRAGQILLADAQTNGGLLLAVEAPLTKALLQAVADEGAAASVIGRIVARDFADGPTGAIRVV
jgi:selenide,water dikinase